MKPTIPALRNASVLLASVSLACGGANTSPIDGEAQGGSLATPVGGASGSGGRGGAATGGAISTSNGGSGIGGAVSNGGTTARGGAATGGSTSTGGVATGGKAATGGAATGGLTSSGGVATGGNAATGGAATGGSMSSGGVATGGKAATGGAATGGLTSTGGVATGGKAATGGAATAGSSSTGGVPPSGTVRVFYLRPTDVAFDQKFPDGIGNVMLETQAFFKQQLGKTFKLNTPIVEVVVGEHVQSWYENTANGGDKYWWSATNAQQEIQRRFKLPDSRWMGVSEVSAEGTGAGGGATGGWVLLCGHDADGGAGYPADKARWVGGMVHEMGHAFGLPDSTSTDGTCMSGSFYGWPNCTFTQSQKDQMLNGSWGTGKFLF